MHFRKCNECDENEAIEKVIQIKETCAVCTKGVNFILTREISSYA